MAFPINNSTQGQWRDGFIPSITSGELLRSDGLFLNKIAKQVNEQDFLTFLESQAAWKTTDDTYGRWHEEGYLSASTGVQATSGGATVGAPFTITLPSAAHQASGTRSPFGAGDVIKIDNFYALVQSKNTTTPSAHVLTCIPTSTMTVAANTVVTTAKTVVKVSKFHAEGTGYTDGMLNLPVKYEEQTGIVKSKIELTGTAASNRLKITDPSTGKDAALYKGDYDCFLQHKLDVNFAALIGPGGTATDASGNTVRLVKGAVTQSQERGTDYLYSGSFSKNDLENFTRILIKQRAGSEQLLQVGHEAHIMMEQFVDDAMKNGARIYLDKASAAAKGNRMVDFGFDGFKLNDFVFFKQSFNAFNHPQITYAAGQPYPYYIWTTPHKMAKDPVTGESGYSIQLIYKTVDGPKGVSFDRKFQGFRGGDGVDTENDVINYRYLTEFGVAVLLANQSIVGRAS
jgi:hypothetical protein